MELAKNAITQKDMCMRSLVQFEVDISECAYLS